MTDYESVGKIASKLLGELRYRRKYGLTPKMPVCLSELESICMAALLATESQSVGQDLAGWRKSISDEIGRLETAAHRAGQLAIIEGSLRHRAEALRWVLEHVLPRPVDTESKSVANPIAYVVADNNFVSAAAFAVPFATLDAAARERDEMEQAAPERDYRVIAIQGAPATECKSYAEYDAKILRKIEGMFEAVGPDLVEALERLRNMDCGSDDGGEK